jgi:hypothetical protein
MRDKFNNKTQILEYANVYNILQFIIDRVSSENLRKPSSAYVDPRPLYLIKSSYSFVKYINIRRAEIG